MPAYKDAAKGTWFVQCAYYDHKGARIRTTKRGFRLSVKRWLGSRISSSRRRAR